MSGSVVMRSFRRRLFLRQRLAWVRERLGEEAYEKAVELRRRRPWWRRVLRRIRRWWGGGW